MTNLEEKIISAEARRAALTMERDDLILSAVEGDDAAARQADTRDAQIAAIDRELSRFGIARQKAAERKAVEDASRRSREWVKHKKAADDHVKIMGTTAREVDAAVEALLDKLEIFTESTARVRDHCTTQEMYSALQSMSAAVAPVIVAALARSGYNFPDKALLTRERQKLSVHVPSPEYLKNIVERGGIDRIIPAPQVAQAAE